MDLVTFLSCAALFYGAIYFIDQFLKSCLNLPYLYFLENLGLKVEPMQINVFSTIFNRPIAKLAFHYKRCFRIWFSIGVVCVILLIVPSLFLLIRNLVSQLAPTTNEVSMPILQPAVPGINLPLEEFPYYFLTLLLASLIHEGGHAIAAAGEDVHINGIGFMLLFALPGAYVDLSKECVNKLSPFRRLKILCAGVWHNAVLALVAFAVGSTLSITLKPLYSTDAGVLVLGMDKDSPARGPRGLNPGDVIESVNFCPVPTVARWRECLVANMANGQLGFCIPESTVNAHDETIHHPFVQTDGSVECCSHDAEGGLKLCFQLQRDESSDVGETPMQPYSCLPPRLAVEQSTKSCVSCSQCSGADVFCLAPSIENASRLLVLSRRVLSGAPSPDVLFLGPPSQLFFTLRVSNYLPRAPSLLSPSLPFFLEVFTDYIVKFSGALGLLNLVPCVYLDGYWISGALIELALGRHVGPGGRRAIHVATTVLGTSLLVATVGLGAWTLL